MTVSKLSRRQFAAGSASFLGLAASGCVTTPEPRAEASAEKKIISATYRAMYGPMTNERFAIPAVSLEKVPEKFWRRQVDYNTSEPVGSVVVDTSNFFLYLVQEGGKALRYGVGLGRAGFEWSGRARIARKQEWPKWTPPAEMIEREPELEKWSAANGGMPPGLMNPLGARALYIFDNGVDTLYRVHGSPEYWTIGKAVSSGCVRLMNQDVIDLYGRVPPGTRILVI